MDEQIGLVVLVIVAVIVVVMVAPIVIRYLINLTSLLINFLLRVLVSSVLFGLVAVGLTSFTEQKKMTVLIAINSAIALAQLVLANLGL